MIIYRKPIEWYVDKLKNDEYFSLAGYSDAEWYCILHHRVGTATALGQIITEEHGEKLEDVLVRRHGDARFMFAMPSCLRQLPAFRSSRIERHINHKLKLWEFEAYERDMVTDDLARDAGLHPFIEQLQKMNVVIIGNEALRGLEFLKYKHFVEISSPNLHMENDGILNAAMEASFGYGEPGVYLISAGVSTAIIIDLLHDAILDSWFIDCGSIWDAFVGIGGQREWRAKLYEDEDKYQKWLNKNLHGEE